MEYRLSFFLIIFILFGCGEDSACLKSAGDEVSFEVKLSPYNAVEINDALEVELVQSEDTLIKVHTKENLKNFISFEVIDNTLIVRDENSCNWMREYNQTKITIFHPNLQKISNQGSSRIYSSDTLYYPSVLLSSVKSAGDYDLIFNNSKIRINVNDLNNINLSGRCNELSVGIYAGDGRIDAKNLLAQHVGFFHRGSNDIMVHPVISLKGEIIGFGNIIYYNEPYQLEIKDSGEGEAFRSL